MVHGQERPWRPVPNGLAVAVRLTPKGGRDAIDGMERLSDGHTVLKARVRAAPHEGAANAALEALIAQTVGTAKGRVRLVSGAAARLKTVQIEGDAAVLSAALERCAGAGADLPAGRNEAGA